MKTVRVSLTKDDKIIEYFFDLENNTYKSYSMCDENGTQKMTISEEGPLGDAANRQTIANRIHFVLLATLKE